MKYSQTSAYTGMQRRIQNLYHPDCVVCSLTNPHGLQLSLEMDVDGHLTGKFQLDGSAEGYPGLSHGGIIASVLDGAMANWLFAHEVVAVTIGLNVKYRHPLCLMREACVRAQLKEDQEPVYVMDARIWQDGRVAAQAIGRFVHRPDIVEQV